MYGALPEFESDADEIRFLRGLVAVQRLADEILEDCLERRLGLSAALDVFLSMTCRLIHAVGGFAQVRGTRGPVLTRVHGEKVAGLDRHADAAGPVAVGPRQMLFVTQLTLGSTRVGTLGFLLPGTFPDGGKQVAALVDAAGEMLDSAVLGFCALSRDTPVLARLDELSEEAAFLPKSRLGHYELLAPLGAGGMAQVLVARTLGPSGVSRLVALKRILPQLASDPALVEQFLDEARIGLRLSHPNVVTVYDFGQAVGGAYFIAMELLRGVDFDRVIYSYPADAPAGVDAALASAVVAQALAGLHAAHEAKAEDGTALGLVHRDLSPHNLMVGFDGRVKLLDFGVAKLRDQRTLTLPGIVKGKPLYMSPEQAVGDRLDRRSDLFAMGLILFEALTGARPFERDDGTQTMQAIVDAPLPVRPAGISRPVWDVISRALAKAPEGRYATAAEMGEALRRTGPLATDAELGALLVKRFPAVRDEYRLWDQTGAPPPLVKA